MRITNLRQCIVLIIFSIVLSFSCDNGNHNHISNAKGLQFDKAHFDEYFINLVDTLSMSGLSVAIINNAEIVYHEVFGTKIQNTNELIDKETYFEAASLSKPLFSFFVMKQADKGLLSLDRPLYEYLPYPDIEYDERYKQITARMILSHTSGFPNWRQDSLKIDFTPGSKYQYSGEGYRYLSEVLATVNNIGIEKLDSLFQVEIVEATGVSNLHFKWNDDIANNKATGHMNNEVTDNLEVREGLHFGAAGGLYTEANGYAHFMMAMMKSEIISKEAYAEMFKEQIKLPADDINSIVMGASGWSLGLGMIPTSLGTCYWHSGNNGDYQSWMHFFPKKKYGIVLFSNSDKIQSPEFFTTFFNFLDDEITFDMSQLE